jgi:hypothetical protein
VIEDRKYSYSYVESFMKEAYVRVMSAFSPGSVGGKRGCSSSTLKSVQFLIYGFCILKSGYTSLVFLELERLLALSGVS